MAKKENKEVAEVTEVAEVKEVKETKKATKKSTKAEAEPEAARRLHTDRPDGRILPGAWNRHPLQIFFSSARRL